MEAILSAKHKKHSTPPLHTAHHTMLAKALLASTVLLANLGLVYSALAASTAGLLKYEKAPTGNGYIFRDTRTDRAIEKLVAAAANTDKLLSGQASYQPPEVLNVKGGFAYYGDKMLCHRPNSWVFTVVDDSGKCPIDYRPYYAGPFVPMEIVNLSPGAGFEEQAPSGSKGPSSSDSTQY